MALDSHISGSHLGGENELAGSGPTDPITPPPRKSFPILLALATAAVVGFAVVLFLFLQARGAKNDTEEALAGARSEVSQLTDQLGVGQQKVATLEDELTQAQLEVSTLEGDLEARDGDVEQMRESVVDFLAYSFSIGAGMSRSDSACVAESMAADRPITELLAAFEGVSESPNGAGSLALSADILSAAADCGISLGGLSGDTQAVAYGDDPGFDALYDECAAGSGTACDQLYLQSVVGSEYEYFGLTCGARYSVASAPFRCEDSI